MVDQRTTNLETGVPLSQKVRCVWELQHQDIASRRGCQLCVQNDVCSSTGHVVLWLRDIQAALSHKLACAPQARTKQLRSSRGRSKQKGDREAFAPHPVPTCSRPSRSAPRGASRFGRCPLHTFVNKFSMFFCTSWQVYPSVATPRQTTSSCHHHHAGLTPRSLQAFWIWNSRRSKSRAANLQFCSASSRSGPLRRFGLGHCIHAHVITNSLLLLTQSTNWFRYGQDFESRYDLKEKVGSGSFGTVYRVTCKLTGEE